ncbi:hypothetical protein [Streptomyces sp. NPDC017529]|uniref:hypothetical protein n=1 Tax=Streptomyces sp. NPDC017529 TaxID=3365000 RepID=UPI0037885910
MGQKDDSVLYLWTKSEADVFKHKLNGVATTVEFLKFGFTGLALGLTPVKIDFTGLKVDEKGIVIAGVQKWTWPHARDAKAKLEAADKKLAAGVKEADKAYRTAKRAQERASRLAAAPRRGGAASPSFGQDYERVTAAEKAQKSLKEAQKVQKDVRRMYQEVHRLERKASQEAKSVADARKASSSSFVQIRKDMRALAKEAENAASSLA